MPDTDPPTALASPSAERRAAVLLPLFSIRSTPGWGLGEIPDLARFAIFCRRAGLRVLQLLPVGQVLGGETSPYSAASAFALDPVYLGLEACEDFVGAGGRGTLTETERVALESVQAAAVVDWPTVKRLKRTGLAAAFAHFHQREWQPRSARAVELDGFIDANRDWLPDHALFVALHDRHGGAFWDWPAALATREPAALATARAELADPILEICWQQWQLDQQWRAARAETAALGVQVMGDLPFMVAGDSSDVWSRPREFRRDRRVGTPPDAFSADGQDWGLPAFDWGVMAAEGFTWMRRRAAHAANLYSLFRLDHVIGMYRTYSRPIGDGDGAFAPVDEDEQLRLGETLLSIFATAGRVVAEDLGLVPDYLRASLGRLEIPGYRVLRWEKEPDGSFRDPAGWPVKSVATTGTHDIEPNAVWWNALSAQERASLVKIPALAQLDPTLPFDGRVRDALIDAVYQAPSELAVVPFQDLLGTAERVNVPGTVADSNWSTRAKQEALALGADRELCERLQALAARARR